ncbi:hypothetical protein J3F84DRAFT_370685 [Trichoderma pleuroticola]
MLSDVADICRDLQRSQRPPRRIQRANLLPNPPPVCLGKKKGKGDPSDNETLGQASDIGEFNLRGVDLKIVPKNLWAVQCFLPHYFSTCPAHLTACKRLASEEPLESILPDSKERKRCLKAYEEFLARLKQGKASRPPALVPISAADDTTMEALV